jgi:obg-like ATPase 1
MTLNNLAKFGFVNIVPQRALRLGRPGVSLKMGIVGMANIGKSSTFNLISRLNVPAENYPFCTIEPNTALIKIADLRFEKLCEMFNPDKVVAPVLKIVDIAGLVKGASEGHGLGNEFLANITSVDGIYQVVRAFQNDNILHTEGNMDPVRDVEIIRDELIKKDLQIITKRVDELAGKAARATHNR